MSDAAPAEASTLDELLEHLDDLVQLVANEKFIHLATELEVILQRARLWPERYTRTDRRTSK